MKAVLERNGLKYRFETFGGIIASEEPPFLAFVDRAFMREMQLGESGLWQNGDESVGILTAPTEVHFAITNRCPAGCAHCYMNAGEPDAGELDTAALKKALSLLADWGVFHVALGGGEALARPDLFEIAAHAREAGLVPNLTVSGALMTPAIAARMTVFGQVNVSIDNPGPAPGGFRSSNLSASADRAVDLLVEAGVSTGINCVVGASNFGTIPELFAHAVRKKINEIEFLRLKPAGRGADAYAADKTTPEQNRELIPLLARLTDEYGICAKIDCSFVPMLCHHNPPRELLERMATYGCEAGNVLLGVRSNGKVCGCSFLPVTGVEVHDLRQAWETHQAFALLRSWEQRAPEPCASCEYLTLCRGGCRAVAMHVTGDREVPDPDCPRVAAYSAERT